MVKVFCNSVIELDYHRRFISGYAAGQLVHEVVILFVPGKEHFFCDVCYLFHVNTPVLVWVWAYQALVFFLA